MKTMIKKENGTLPATLDTFLNGFYKSNLEKMFNDDFWSFNGVHTQNHAPANILETSTAYEISILAPGRKKENFRLKVADNLLTVSFEQQQSSEQEKSNWLRTEFSLDTFSRTFTLNDNIDSNAITAQYNDGILHITLPKKQQTQVGAREINIQ
jgi:HSP20 family protein